MSFSLEVKKEICLGNIEESSQTALLCGAILSSGSLVIKSGGISFTLSSENNTYIEFVKNLIIKMYPHATFDEFSSNVNFKQKARTELKIDNVCGRQILTDLGILSFSNDGNFIINRLGGSFITIENQSKIEFLKGMFLGGGSISVPEPIDINDFSKSVKNSGYHMEWNVQTQVQAEYISELLAEQNIISRIVERNDSFVVYLKEAESISELLGVFGAHKAVLNLENDRAGREMRNLVNRQANCISANIDKSINAALKELEAIETIKQTIGLEALPKPLFDIAIARIENPQGSLNEIAEALENKVSKGTVSQRFKKIIAIAKEVL